MDLALIQQHLKKRAAASWNFDWVGVGESEDRVWILSDARSTLSRQLDVA